jgi:hypothetical protein
MEILFDHICGKQANTDFIHTLISATFLESEYDMALDSGWCPSNIWYCNDTNFKKNNKIIWYQSRQSRINLSKYKKSKNERRLRNKVSNYGVNYNITKFPNFDLLYNIYKKYIKHKKYKDSMSKSSFLESYSNTDELFIVYDDVAFSVMEIYSKNLISHQFCWDYSNPSLSLGKFSTYIEIDFALKNNLKNVYLGPSYEIYSKYKSQYRGFEFWTGRKWCDDRNIFESLLKKDSSLNSIDEITEEYKNYLSLLSV